MRHAGTESVSAREHGDANILISGADTIDDAAAEHILNKFLTCAALGDRYPRVESVCSNSMLQGF